MASIPTASVLLKEKPELADLSEKQLIAVIVVLLANSLNKSYVAGNTSGIPAYLDTLAANTTSLARLSRKEWLQASLGVFKARWEKLSEGDMSSVLTVDELIDLARRELNRPTNELMGMLLALLAHEIGSYYWTSR